MAPPSPRGLLLLLAAALLGAGSQVLVAALTTVGGRESPAAVASPPARPRVIVIGVGLAGITVARELADAGAAEVLVLEARARVGGRLHSVDTRAGPVDLGAMWIHEGQPSNPLYALAESLGLNISAPHNYNSAKLAMPDGSPINPFAYIATYTAFLQQLRGRITSLRSAANDSSPGAAPAEDVPLAQLYSEWLEASSPRWRPEQVPIAHLIMHQQFQTLLNANITRLSSLRFGDAKTLPNVDVLLQQGFDSVAKLLAPGLNISLNSTVTAVSQDASGVSVALANGSSLAADWALVTLPLGVLKANSVAFAPPLPAAKQAAIQEMGMGVLDKLVLVFPSVWWDPRLDFLSITSGDWSGRWSSWLNYAKVWGPQVPVLVALNAADTARSLEAMPDADIVAEAMQVLRRTYPSVSVPQPSAAYVTRWAADEAARGSYSYYATGNAANITDVLAEPHGRVLFAGEATSSKPATVLGALLSGRREAARLQRLLGVPAPAAGGAEAGPGPVAAAAG